MYLLSQGEDTWPHTLSEKGLCTLCELPFALENARRTRNGGIENKRKNKNQQRGQTHTTARQHSTTRQHSTARHSTGRRTAQDTAPAHQTTGQAAIGQTRTPGPTRATRKQNHSTRPTSKHGQRHQAPNSAQTAAEHGTQRHDGGTEHNTKNNKARSTTGGAKEQHSTTPTTEQNRTDSRAPQHGTTRQQSATEHRTEHRGAARHNKPKHTAGQEATRTGRSSRAKAHQRKSTAGNQTQQRTPSNHRHQQTARASRNEATGQHQQEPTQKEAHHTTGGRAEQHSTAPQDRTQQRATTGDQATATGGSSRGGDGRGTPHNAADLTTRRHRAPGQHKAQHTTQQRATAPRRTKHLTKQHGTTRQRTTQTKKGGRSAHGRPQAPKPTTQLDSTPHRTTRAPRVPGNAKQKK